MFKYIVLSALVTLTCVAQSSLEPYPQTAGELFDSIDADSDNILVITEISQYFVKFDRDHNGQVTRQEFNAYIDEQNSKFKGHEHALYDYFDMDDDHHLTYVDFQVLFNMNDVNADSFVQKSEFVPFFTRVFQSLSA